MAHQLLRGAQPALEDSGDVPLSSAVPGHRGLGYPENSGISTRARPSLELRDVDKKVAALAGEAAERLGTPT